MKNAPGTNVGEALVLAVLEDIPLDKTFAELDGHMTETGVTDNHVFLLIKSETRNYLKIRMHHLAKEANQTRIKNDRVRKWMNRLVVNKNQ